MRPSLASTCFVIMPFGDKRDARGRKIDFDKIYRSILVPAITEAELTPVRCDEVAESGLVHRRMLELIRDARAAVVDISLLNANVFYELGVRHALRRSVTVMVRRRGTEVPFNVANLKLIEYDEHRPEHLAAARTAITEHLVNGLRSTRVDSLVHELLDLTISGAGMGLPRQQVHRYDFPGHPVSFFVVTGGIENLRGIDVWVNPENTNMQMARFYDWSVSAMIRYLGARRDGTGSVTTLADDLVANELGAVLQGRTAVPAGQVVATGAGELLRSHQVKKIFHAACVQGAPGAGYRPVDNLGACVSAALERLDSSECRSQGLSSIAFPLLGAGVRPQQLEQIVRTLFEAAIAYVERTPRTGIRRVLFLPWTAHELETCLAQLDAFPELTRRRAGVRLEPARKPRRTRS